MRLSVVIPAYNEEKRLPGTVSKLKAILPFGTEIIVSDDGSTDKTLATARALGCKISTTLKNTGKSGAVIRGVKAAAGDAALICDADLPVEQEDIERLIKIYVEQNCDMVIASRHAHGAVTRRTPLRWLAGKAFSYYVRVLFGLPYKDTQCGIKLVNLKTSSHIFDYLQEKGYLFDIELLWLARKAAAKVVELPVTWEEKPGSKVSLLKDAPKMFIGAITLRYRLQNAVSASCAHSNPRSAVLGREEI